ncbi:hypothetical protein L2E82_37456 [Cichorium intybus]|uniref:Uncharacterized protein n=1 Tax=Cichorium intybus TaxID=13427 RepID=A0ACB9AE40_CICIN|nr:hypothetical protein L2E82_37456 [Cichorium intybus]
MQQWRHGIDGKKLQSKLPFLSAVTVYTSPSAISTVPPHSLPSQFEHTMITCVRPLSSSSNHSLLSYTFLVDRVVFFGHSFVYRHESSRHSPLKTIAQSDSPELLASASFHRSSQRNAHIVRVSTMVVGIEALEEEKEADDLVVDEVSTLNLVSA